MLLKPAIKFADEKGSDLSELTSNTYNDISLLYKRVISDQTLKQKDKDSYLI